MGLAALKLLADSILGSKEAQQEQFASISDEELKKTLAAYRERTIQAGFTKANSLGVAVSAREDMTATKSAVKRSVLYFDEVLLPCIAARMTRR